MVFEQWLDPISDSCQEAYGNIMSTPMCAWRHFFLTVNVTFSHVLQDNGGFFRPVGCFAVLGL